MTGMRSEDLTSLSVSQRRAHSKLSTTEWRSSYELKETRGTLGALVQLGLVKVRHDLGAAFFPRTGVKYLLTAVCIECGSCGPRAERCDESCPMCGRSFFCNKEDPDEAAQCEARSP